MSTYSDWLKIQALRGITQPLSVPVRSNGEAYLEATGFEKLGWRHVRRAVQFKLSGQQKQLHSLIAKDWKRGLWIYKGVPQLGDALMDLAPRSLLTQQGLKMDIYTDKHIAEMLVNDPWFEQIYENPDQIDVRSYDFMIVQSHKDRSLKHKSGLSKNHPWVSMHGFYTGPEFHRGQFATQRLADLLSCSLSEQEFDWHQKQKLKPLEIPIPNKNQSLLVALALGGVDQLRTYRNWTALLCDLKKVHSHLNVTLLGTSNAEQVAKDLIENCHDISFNNQVNQTTISQCRELIAQQNILVTADGGLMHLGVTTSVEMISLFHKGVQPCWRLSGNHLHSALQSPTSDVNDTAHNSIVTTIMQMITTKKQAANT